MRVEGLAAGDRAPGPSGWKAIRRWVRRVWVTLGILVMLALGRSFQAHGVDPAVLRSDARVRVLDGPAYLEMDPTEPRRLAGLLFFPGGMVQPEAYAPIARAVAEAGFPAVIFKLPFLGRHAPTERYKRAALDRAIDRMREAGPEMRWVVASHSFGGVLASRHGIAPPAKAALNDAMLPADARRVEIEGANDAGFAYYGPQLGDGRAAIPRREQQQRLVSLLIAELERVSRPDGDAPVPRLR